MTKELLIDTIFPVCWRICLAAGLVLSHLCQILGRIVIVEAPLPDHLKTVRSVNVGGIAGGEKFLSHNMFIKRVMDDNGLYGGLEVSWNSYGSFIWRSNVAIMRNIRPWIEFGLG